MPQVESEIWKWIAGIIAALYGTGLILWMRSMHTDMRDIKSQNSAVDQRLNDHAERIARAEAMTSGLHDWMRRLDISLQEVKNILMEWKQSRNR